MRDDCAWAVFFPAIFRARRLERIAKREVKHVRSAIGAPRAWIIPRKARGTELPIAPFRDGRQVIGKLV